MIDPLEAYVRLLARWNERINLTALPVEDPTDATIDRLLIEPLAAARHVRDSWTPWFDVGSGGGSPALPLKVARPTLALTMVESTTRKAAFLREAVRVLRLDNATVESTRFEEVAVRPKLPGTLGLVTLRAVRPTAEIEKSALNLLKPEGRLLVFRSSSDEVNLRHFRVDDTVTLLPNQAFGVLLRPNVPRGT